MHKGEFIGSEASRQKRKILILGESHHVNNKDKNSPDNVPGVETSYTTCSVVQEYLADTDRKNNTLYFFHKIAQSFGVDSLLDVEQKLFWEKVYLGNYIDVLCGVGDSYAVNLLNCECNRKKYNNQLFKFVNEHEIDVICCFGRRVYNALPSLATDENEHKDITGGIWLDSKLGSKRRDRISHCIYLPHQNHDYTRQTLKKPLEVYGMLHPSGQYGFNPENYVSTLSDLIDF